MELFAADGHDAGGCERVTGKSGMRPLPQLVEELAGLRPATFDLVPTDDEVAEGSETVTVSGTVNGLSVDPATLTITDDDAEPTKVILSVNPATVSEDDGSTQITVTGTLDGAARL